MELLDKQLPCNLMTIVLHDTKIMEILMTFLAIMSNGFLHAIQFPIVIERHRAGDLAISLSARSLPQRYSKRFCPKGDGQKICRNKNNRCIPRSAQQVLFRR